jgi:hypothetical protein
MSHSRRNRIVRDYAARHGLKFQQAKQHLDYINARIDADGPTDLVFVRSAGSGGRLADLICDDVGPLNSMRVHALADLMPRPDARIELRRDLEMSRVIIVLLNRDYVRHYESIASDYPHVTVARRSFVLEVEAEELRAAAQRGSRVIVVPLERGVIDEVPAFREFTKETNLPVGEMSESQRDQFVGSIRKHILVTSGVLK